MMAYSRPRVTTARVSAPPKGGLPEKGALSKGDTNRGDPLQANTDEQICLLDLRENVG